MELIIGGAFQGKLRYAREQHPEVTFLDGAVCTLEELLTCQGVYDFQKFLCRALKEGQDMEELSRRIVEENPELLIVSCEVGYGVVPIDAFERAYREAVGRVCTNLASYAHKVTRVVCGVGMVIKGA